MKIRNGFVSNSSSASFVIDLTKTTPEQLKMIKNHIKAAFKWAEDHDELIKQTSCDCGVDYSHKDFGCLSDSYKWRVNVNKKSQRITCSTYMDNFDLLAFCKAIGITEVSFSKIDGENWD